MMTCLSWNPPSGNCWSAIARRKSTVGHRLWIRVSKLEMVKYLSV
jgi:hypothetical protein